MSLLGFRTIYGVNAEHATPYLTQAWIGRLRLHIFHRGDADPDPHNHPWPFWTFPLTSYVEEVTEQYHDCGNDDCTVPSDGAWRTRNNVVRAFHLHYRPASYTHRVICRVIRAQNGIYPTREAIYRNHNGYHFYKPGEGKIVTIVWRGRGNRHAWGFLKHRDGKWCWVPWKTYVYDGGKHAPCE